MDYNSLPVVTNAVIFFQNELNKSPNLTFIICLSLLFPFFLFPSLSLTVLFPSSSSSSVLVKGCVCAEA